jgi:hypothetical protein
MFRRLLASLPFFFCSVALAQPLTTSFTFQGDLKSSGSPATGLYDARFRLYDAATGGTQLGPTLCSDNLSLTNGVFTTQLDFGAQFTGQQRFLEVDIRQDTGLNCSNSTGFTTLTPRQPLTAAPNAIYSLSAAAATNATQLNGQPSSFYTNATNLSGALPSTGLAGAYTSTLNLSNTSNLFTGSFSGSGANLTGIPYAALTGAPTPVLLQASSPGSVQSGNLNVNGTGRFGALQAANGINPRTNATVGDLLNTGGALPMGLTTEVGSGQLLNLDLNFRATGTNPSRGAAVRLDSRSGIPAIQFITRPAGSVVENTVMDISETGQVNINARAADALTVTNPIGRGLRITTSVDSPIATTTATANGIFSDITGTTTQNTALWGHHTSPVNLNWALFARTESVAGRGVEGYAGAATGSTYAVLGTCASPSGFGVFSSGNTGASGTKSFRIDHPDDPANKYLLHYSSESPEVINFYRGTITLNEQGEAEVPLPSYFAKINKDPSYQLTAVGAPMPLLHVSKKINPAALAEGAQAAPQDPAPACSFHISGGAPNAEVCWRVEATRNDRWTQTHGAPVEVEKQGIEKGTYQDPALYNQPPETGTFSKAPLQTPSSVSK